MENQELINSDSYWNGRFSENWETNDGPSQSRFFSKIAIESLPNWFLRQTKRDGLSMVDWGCAQGDGTDVWASYIDPSQISGVDFSSVAILQASQRYPAIRFINEDWLDEKTPGDEKFDIVFSSNTLEHFHRPYEALRVLSKRADKAIVLALPYREENRIDEHFFSFLPENIPLELQNGFKLVWSRVVDCRNRPGTLWGADQIILVYADPAWITGLSLNLVDCEISHCDIGSEISGLNEKIKERDAQITSLSNELHICSAKLAHSENLLREYEIQGAQLRDILQYRNEEFAQLQVLLAETESKSASLESALKQRDKEITKLSLAGHASEEEIKRISSQLDEVNTLYAQVMKTKVSNIKSFVRVIRHNAVRSKNLAAIFGRTMRSHGVRYALSKTGNYLQGKKEISSASMSNQEAYNLERSAQNAYVTNFLSSGIDQNQLDLLHEHFAHQAINWNKVVLFPLSYPLELTQRPDHLLRNFSENGYHCIIIAVDNQAPYVRELKDGIFLTNLFATTIGYFSNKKVSFYITYPFYSYIINHLHNAVVVYDVLDDLSVFSLNCKAMQEDHINLLARAEVTLFSSNELMRNNANYVKGASHLVTNGVWIKDFALLDAEQSLIKIKNEAKEFVLGYHGAISELLDWNMLERIIAIPELRLVLIGPIVNFDNAVTDEAAAQKRVLASENTTYIPTVPYSDLKYYIRGFDAGIVPFKVNEKTDPVSPLKLFEYMAVGLKVFATPTKTLSAYSDFITVADSSILPDRIANVVAAPTLKRQPGAYQEILVKADWAAQMAPVLAQIDEIILSKKPTIHSSKTVDIVNVNFYDWDGDVLYKGGAERYVFDLACMLKEHGWMPRILQNANREFSKEYRGIPIVGVATGCGHDLRGMSKKYREICKNADLVIASPLDLACELWGLNVIGINHGIYWDHKFKTLSNANINEYRNIFDALKVVSSGVCVDTNFINWVRTFDYALGKKLKYVPNYFEGSEFCSTEKDFSGKICVLYPRRLYEARGIFITLQAFEYLFKRYDNLELHLVGQADSNDEKIVSEFVEKFNGRVTWEELDMHEMFKAYRDSHIALVPTMYSEGTSLSCLEAMATNNAVIATNIGGLPNLVIDGFNGLLIDPNSEALVKAIESILMDREKMRSMASKGLDMAQVFEKQHWRKRWMTTVSEVKI